MKKFFIITSVLFAIFLLLFVIYNFFFKSNPFDAKVPGVAIVSKEEPEKSKKEPVSTEKIAVFVDESATAPAFDANANSLLYLASEERSLKEMFVATGLPKRIVEFDFVPRNIVWSPDMTRALVKKSDTEWALFTRKTEEVEGDSPVRMLKSGIENPAWTHLGDAIVYKYYNSSGGVRTITVANPDGSDWSVIGETISRFLEIRAVPRSSMMAFWNQGNAFEETLLKTISTVGGEAKEIFSKSFGVDYAFAPDGESILMSSTIERGGSAITLSLINMYGGDYRNLFIPTIVGKTTWSKNSRFVYYALPGGLPSGSVLPNDYYRKPILTADTFWKVDVKTGETSRIADPADIDQGYDAEYLVVNDDETMLFFRNRRDGKIYRINL